MAEKRKTILQKAKFNNGTDTWSAADESSKGQLSLDMGSDEYEEFIEDRKENAPTAPRDKMHEELEKRNESLHSIKRAEKALENEMSTDDIKKIKFRKQEAKREVKKLAHAVAVREAFRTMSKSDDERLDDADVEQEMIYDDSIEPGDFDDRWAGYVGHGRY